MNIKIVKSGVNKDIIDRIRLFLIMKIIILICYGDTVINININKLIDFKKNKNKLYFLYINLNHNLEFKNKNQRFYILKKNQTLIIILILVFFCLMKN